MPPLAALAPIVILVVAYVAWIITDITRSEVKHLPRWGWILVTILSVPVGGIVYLLAGRQPR